MNTPLPLNRRYLLVCLIALFFVLLPYSLFAQFTKAVKLGEYIFQGESNSDDQELKASGANPYTYFSEFKRVGLIRAAGSNVLSSTGWSIGALDTTQYLEFIVSAGPEYRVHINSISLQSEIDADGPMNIRVATNNGSKEFNKNFTEFERGVQDFKWDGGEAVIDVNQSVTFRIYGYNASKTSGAFSIDNVRVGGTLIPNIRFNEFHYTAGNDADNPDFIEVIVPKSFTDLDSVTLTLYEDTNGDGLGKVYGTPTLLSSFNTLDESSYDSVNVYYLDIPAGLAPIGGFSLTTPMDLIEFLSYGTNDNKSIEAVDGAAAGEKSMDVGVTEDDDTKPDNAIFLPEGKIAAWTYHEEGVNSKGFRNGVTNIILPVELIYFKSNKTSQGVMLTWATASEKDNDYFLVERSNSPEEEFTPIAKIMGKGTTLEKQTYQTLDEGLLSGTAYYRLKQVDYDGKFAFSKIIAVNSQLEQFTVYPNPATNSINIAFSNAKAKALHIQIYNNMGQLVDREDIVGNNAAQAKRLSLAHLPAGTYLLVLLDGSSRYSKKFIKL